MTENPGPDRRGPTWRDYLIGFAVFAAFWVVLALTIGRCFGS